MALSNIPTAQAAGTPCSITPVLTETDLNTCIAEAPTDNSEFTITLGASFSLTAVKNIPANTNITLTSSVPGGATLSLQTGNTARHLAVHGTFTLTSGVTLQGFGDGVSLGGGVLVTATGTFNMTGGAITGNTSDQGGGILTYGGSHANMTGGTISNNTATSNGGGIRLGGGEFIMSGGQISNNTALIVGGGVDAIGNSVFIMPAGGTGKIINNTAVGGGGIESTNEFYMSSGEISGNTSSNWGGGVSVGSTGTFTMDGGIISGNTAAGNSGGVANGGTFTMSGNAIVSGNTAGNSGGGVGSSGIFNMSAGATIIGNIATNDGGGINFAGAGAIVTITGGQIADNTAGANGGAISTAYENLSNLTVDAGTVFAGNSAAIATRMRPTDQTLYDAQIFTTSFSLPLPFNGYNNYDISYASDLPTDICQYNVSLWADDTKCVAAPGTGLFGAQISGATISALSLIAGGIIIVAIFASRKLIARR